MNTLWTVVCDASRARIFEIRDVGAEWVQVDTLEHAASREKSSDLATDHLGQKSPEGGSVHHAAMAPASFPKDVEKEHFAHALVKHLDQALRNNKFGHWVLVAPPHFLGLVKGELAPQLQKHLFGTVNKDLVSRSMAELSETLANDVRLTLDLVDPAVTQRHKRAH